MVDFYRKLKSFDCTPVYKFQKKIRTNYNIYVIINTDGVLAGVKLKSS